MPTPSPRSASSEYRAPTDAGVIQESLVAVATPSSELGWGLAVADEQPRPGTTVEALGHLTDPLPAARASHGGQRCRPQRWSNRVLVGGRIRRR